MCWLATAAATATADVVVDADEFDDDDDDEEDAIGKRVWWHGRPLRIKTGTATRRGEANVGSIKFVFSGRDRFILYRSKAIEGENENNWKKKKRRLSNDFETKFSLELRKD